MAALFLVCLQPMYLFLETVLGFLQFLILSCVRVWSGRVGSVRVGSGRCEGVGRVRVGRGEGVKGWGWEG